MRITMLAVGVLATLACTTQTVVPEPRSYIATKHPKSIWVVREDETTRVDSPEMHGDTIVGTVDGKPFSVRARNVQVNVSEIDWPLTEVLAGAGALVVLVLVNPHVSLAH
ncbi:MAG TPA: hypothetical protein VN848_10955 [Gemmatimonadales bacterium]|nr:hypothetical protein [Gemmatimonadales bacterium]